MINTLYAVQGFAQTYSESSYGNSTYGTSSTTNTTTGTSAGSSSGTLTNTGMVVSAVVAIACLVIFAALLVRFWRKPARAANAATPAHPANEDTIKSSEHSID